MKEIPKVIHQIWSGVNEPLPGLFKVFSKTWKRHHPTWEYMLWDNQKMIDFIQEFYPFYLDIYNAFKYDVQRWDAIRYLILYKMGGMYVDFDYECLEPLDDLLKTHECCFSAEPAEHAELFHQAVYFNNALMASVPEHPFMKPVIESVFHHLNPDKEYPNKMMEVLNTTGPLLLSGLYAKYNNKESVRIIPAELVSPFTKADVQLYLSRERDEVLDEYLENKLEKAVAVHYFIGAWL